MEPNSNPDFDKAVARLINLRTATNDEITRGMEITSLQVGFYDKLVILNGGTFALTFTAAASIHGHLSPGKAASLTGDLFLSWELLMFSIVASLVSNWIIVSAYADNATMSTANTTRIHRWLAYSAVRKMKPDLPPTPIVKHEKQVLKLKLTNAAGYFGVFMGLAAQLATYSSYIFLFRFAKANLFNL